MKRFTRRVASIVMPILAVVALGACGGGTGTQEKNAYAREVNAAQTKFALTVSNASQDSRGDRSLTQQQQLLRRFHTAIESVVRDLRNIDAPSEVSQEHNQLVSVMSSYGDEIGRADETMRNPTPLGAEQAKQRLASASRSVSTQVNAAIAAINVKLRGE
jgi:CHASE3 domain sensor protein